jgi:hypothetical protein
MASNISAFKLAAIKMVLLNKIPNVTIPDEITLKIAECAFINSSESINSHKAQFINTYDEINESQSRKSMENDNGEQWCFGCDFYPQVQAINCSKCGGYLASTKLLNRNIVCICHHRVGFLIDQDYY